MVIKGFLGFCFGLMSCVPQPAKAESVTANQTPENRENLVNPLTSAQSLFASPSQVSGEITSIVAQRPLDMVQFCQNYPYNSKCTVENSTGEPGKLENAPGKNLKPQAELNRSQKNSGWAIVPEISTLGLGGHVVKKITPNLDARLGVNNFGRDININETDYDYKGDLNLFNVSTLIDYQPFKKVGIRLSSGLVFGNNNVQGTADISEQVANGLKINLEESNIDNLASINTDIEINEGVAPYLGIGGGNAVKPGKGLGFWWDLGVVFSGSPNAEVTSDFNFPDNIRKEVQERVIAQTEESLKDEEKDLNEALDMMGVYPVLSLGLSYQF